MKLIELKNWIESLPQELQENLDVVISREGELTEEHSYRLDVPIISVSVDEDNNEACIFIENDKKVNEEAAADGMATLDATTGMGAPSYANRDTEGSGDVPSPSKKKKKKKSKIKKFTDFNQK